MTAHIYQHGQHKATWGVGNAKEIDEDIRGWASSLSVLGRMMQTMETGYYNLEIVDEKGKVLDSEILIA